MVDCPRTQAVFERGRAEGLHLGAQIYVSHQGQVVADLALGQSKVGIPMRPGTLQLWLSSGKPLTAVAIGQLQEQGRLDWDDPVTRLIPEFAQRGKEQISIRH